MQDAETTSTASAAWGVETTTRPLRGTKIQEPQGARRETTSLSSALRAGNRGKPFKKEETISPLHPWLEVTLKAVQKPGKNETFRETTSAPSAPWRSETTRRPLGPNNQVARLSKPVAKKQEKPGSPPPLKMPKTLPEN